MAGFWDRRRTRKACRELLHHARHVAHMREDVAAAEDFERLAGARARMAAACRARDYAAMEAAYEPLAASARRLWPPRSQPWIRENLEILVVAVAVAMGFRAYFIQPFKIPTGSMQPTLYGIHYRHQTAAGLTDLYPLRPVKWLVFGEWYCEFPARASGTLRGPLGETNGNLAYEIGGVLHAVPRDLPLECAPGEPVIRGQMLARGLRTTGDHIFVNKVAWYFTRPRRGDVMVFSTDHIPSLHEKKTHYIKRLVGLPGERIRVDPPNLLVNERRVDRPRSVTRIEERVGEYAGYQNPPGAGGRHLVTPRSVMTLAPTDYLGLGDNTLNSYDGRYWGPVPRGNLVGPAFGVYWPLSRRWGPIR